MLCPQKLGEANPASSRTQRLARRATPFSIDTHNHLECALTLSKSSECNFAIDTLNAVQESSYDQVQAMLRLQELGEAIPVSRRSQRLGRCATRFEIDRQNHFECALTLSKSAECNFEIDRPIAGHVPIPHPIPAPFARIQSPLGGLR